LACNNDGPISDERCLGVELVRVTARANTINVGDTLTYHAELLLSDCMPPDIATEDWRWKSFDTTIARIDSLSGVAEGVAPGTATIQAAHAMNPGVESWADLQVEDGAEPTEEAVPGP
jgi:hypothetical protein